MEIWKDSFKASVLRVGFRLSLSRSMCEFLSAVGDNVAWNRASLGAASADPDNFIPTGRSLERRGLIERKSKAAIDARFKVQVQTPTRFEFYNWNNWQLTPAGKHVVELLRLCEMYVEADIAIEKKARTAVR